jgi:hypothetical protein
MDQQVELRGNPVIHQPSEKDTAKQVKVLKVSGDDLSVLVIIVTVLILGQSRGAQWGQNQQDSKQRHHRDTREASEESLCRSLGHEEVLSVGLATRRAHRSGAQTCQPDAAQRFYTYLFNKKH